MKFAGLMCVLAFSSVLACAMGQSEPTVKLRSSTSSVRFGESFSLWISVEGERGRLQDHFNTLIQNELSAFALSMVSRSEEAIGPARLRVTREFEAQCLELGLIRIPGEGKALLSLEVAGNLDPATPGLPENPLRATPRAWRRGLWSWLLLGLAGTGTLLAGVTLYSGSRRIRSTMRLPERTVPWREVVDALRTRWADAAHLGKVPPEAIHDLSIHLRKQLLGVLSTDSEGGPGLKHGEALSQEQLVDQVTEHFAASGLSPLTDRECLVRLLEAGEATAFGPEAASLSSDEWKGYLEDAAGLCCFDLEPCSRSETEER